MLRYRRTMRSQSRVLLFHAITSAYLIEFTIIAAYKLAEVLIELFQHSLSRLVPESWVFALFLVIVLEGKIEVGDVRFPEDLVFPLLEGSGLVRESVKSYQIGHASFVLVSMDQAYGCIYSSRTLTSSQ